MNILNMQNEAEVDHIATAQESVDEWRFNVGYDERNISKAWLLHDRDVWVKNPFYVGAPQPHPEDERFDEDFAQMLVDRNAADRDQDDLVVDDLIDEARLEQEAEACDWLRAHEG